MTFMHAAGLGVRLFSLWVFLFALQALAAALAWKNNFDHLSTAQTALILSPTLMAIGLGVVLWRFPLGIARILVPRGADNAASITVREAWRLGSVLIGLITFASGAPALLRVLTVFFLDAQSDYVEVPSELKADFVFAFAKTAFALLLVFGSEHVYRSFGVSSQRSAAASDTPA